MIKKLALAVLLLYGCAEKVPLNENSACYPLNDEAALLAAEAQKQGIPHVFDEKEKCIYTAYTHREKISKLEVLIFGDPPPPGLSMSWHDDNPKMIELLKNNGIATKKYVHHGIEWIAWSHKDHQAAEDLLKLDPRTRKVFKRQRDENSKQLDKVPTSNIAADVDERALSLLLTNETKVCSDSIGGSTIDYYLVGGRNLYVREKTIIPTIVKGLNHSSAQSIANAKGGTVGLIRKPMRIHSNKKYTKTGIIDTTITEYQIHDSSLGEITFTVRIIERGVIVNEKSVCSFKTRKLIKTNSVN